MIEKRKPYLAIAIILAMLLLAACQPGVPAATQAAATEGLPITGATTEAPSTTAAPLATEAMTEAPPTTAAPSTTEAATHAPASTEGATGTQAGGATGSAAGVACTLSSEAEQQLVTAGESVYSSTCTACHGPQGEGQGDFPALAGNTDIEAQDPIQLIQALTNPQIHPFADQLSNEETAAVLSYVRSEFGNQATAICTEQVDAVRPGQ